MTSSNLLAPLDSFARRHIGPQPGDLQRMLTVVNAPSLDALIDQTVPASIRLRRPLELPAARGEHDLVADLREVAAKNSVRRSLIGAGYHDTITPPVILRNILENPGWYTQYTPYQAEISQGRMEALVNFQTVVCDLTGLEIANASLLDEATAAAEAMAMAWGVVRRAKSVFVVAADCHPQTIAVVRTRAIPLGIDVRVLAHDQLEAATADAFGVLVQYPTTLGDVRDYSGLAALCHANNALLIVAADLLALTLLKPPGEFGADIAVGSTQRFGVPMGFGGPHAAFLATHEKHARVLPGRLIGVSRDVHGNHAYRLTLQTREQHIRRDKATSNICTAQVLLAVMAGMYAVYHGPEGLRAIASKIHQLTQLLARTLSAAGVAVENTTYFDTLTINVENAAAIHAKADAAGINLRNLGAHSVGVSLDEKSTVDEVAALVAIFTGNRPTVTSLLDSAELGGAVVGALSRTSTYLQHPVFSRYRSEHELLRYIFRLQGRDLSLTTSMIPLGSCTMKLNATTEMIPVTWPEFGALHPFAPLTQAQGYAELFTRLERWLAEITGFAGVSLQPNAGSQGEYAGLLTIRAWHESRGDSKRNVCLIPVSAHGTNPASAAMVGMHVVVVKCDDAGNIDIADLEMLARKHANELGALMITYPSTHGVFEETVVAACEIIHAHGGQVYMDGANMNAQVGLCRPGDIGADVCHLNLHKTFCIPHGGGGPGVGPIGVARHLVPFLPGHPLSVDEARGHNEPVSAAEFGSASILTISYAYIALMGPDGLRSATEYAILNANYMAARLRDHYDVLYTGANGRVAHEFIIDLRPFKVTAGVEAEDVAKRLIDYGFHAPTMSWPVPGTLMFEPTESESLEELDRFCDAMLLIRDEIREIAEGRLDRVDNPLKNAPHTAAVVTADEWTHAYTRQRAAFPAPWVRDHKFWPHVGRVDNAWGDRNLHCSCIPVSEYNEA